MKDIIKLFELYNRNIITFSNISEIIGVIRNEKLLFRFGSFSKVRALKVEKILLDMGLKTSIISKSVDFESNPNSNDKYIIPNKNSKTNFYYIFASKFKYNLNEVINVEQSSDYEKVSYFYGYPVCCIKNYFENSNKNWWEYYKKKEILCNLFTNKIPELFGKPTWCYEYFPCSGNCNKTIEIGKRNMQNYSNFINGSFSSNITESLRKLYILSNSKIVDSVTVNTSGLKWVTETNNTVLISNNKIQVHGMKKSNEYILFV